MAEWFNENTEKGIKEEVEGLATVFTTLARMPKKRAERVLRFCAAYIGESDGDKLDPASSKLADQLIEQIMGKKGL